MDSKDHVTHDPDHNVQVVEEAVQSLRQTQSTFQSVMESYKERFTSTVSRLQQRCDQQAQELQDCSVRLAQSLELLRIRSEELQANKDVSSQFAVLRQQYQEAQQQFQEERQSVDGDFREMQSKIEQLEHELERTTESASQAQRSLQDTEDELNQVVNAHDALKKEHQQALAQVDHLRLQYEDAVRARNNDKEKWVRNDNAMRSRERTLLTKVVSLEKELDEVRNAKQTADLMQQSKDKESTHEVKRLAQRNAELEEEVITLRTQHDALREDNARLKRESFVATNKTRSLDKAMDEQKHENHVLQKQVEVLLTEVWSLKEQNASHRAKLPPAPLVDLKRKLERQQQQQEEFQQFLTRQRIRAANALTDARPPSTGASPASSRTQRSATTKGPHSDFSSASHAEVGGVERKMRPRRRIGSGSRRGGSDQGHAEPHNQPGAPRWANSPGRPPSGTSDHQRRHAAATAGGNSGGFRFRLGQPVPHVDPPTVDPVAAANAHNKNVRRNGAAANAPAKDRRGSGIPIRRGVATNGTYGANRRQKTVTFRVDPPS